MKKFNLLKCVLSLFDGEGSSAASVGAEGEQGEVKGTVPGSTRRAKSGEFENVIFGKQNSDSKATNTENDLANENSSLAAEEKQKDVKDTSSAKDRRKAYSDFINGEFKDIHTEETQRIIDRRFAQTKVLEEQMGKSQPILDMLMLRYNIADGDIDKLKTAIENDNIYFSEAAAEAGMDLEQFKEIQKLKLQNAELVKREKARLGEQSAREQLNKWYGEVDSVKAKFPNFDINAEVKNPSFLSMLKSGVPMEHAYKVLHMDEIVSDAMHATAVDTEKRVVENVRAKGTRPIENGTQSQSAFTVKDDVSKLTRKERAEIARRAMRGEHIEF